MGEIFFDRACPLFVHRFGGPHCALSVDGSVLKKLHKGCPEKWCALRDRALSIPGQREAYEARNRSDLAEQCEHFS